MEKTLFRYIWRYSARQQVMLLALTLATFPVLYVTLEIPKRIINDAIQASGFPRSYYGVTVSQIELLAILSGAFLLFVALAGVMKMRLNTYKGIVAERLLRRFRYQLVSRILRFPLPHFRRTSQGELVSMVTAEAEPLGGIMGDALAQPLFQAGQMLTILGFLFVQSVWLGLAAIALIPVQAYVIPMLQRRINLLNKKRVLQVRRLSERIGESAAGVSALRANNGVPYMLASFTSLLGDLYKTRFEIYQKKFFMKFLNNFINQLTPFFFFSIGGYLAIQGSLSVGALVAALAAYKDLSAPWRELLLYYNQVQDMSLRYQTIIDEFEPAGMFDERLVEGRPTEIPSLKGPIRLSNVSVDDPDGGRILKSLTVEIPGGAMVAVKSESDFVRRALWQVLSRTISPSAGQIEIAGHDLAALHQGAIAAKIGVADGAPYFFNTSVAENLQMPLRLAPRLNGSLSPELKEEIEEALSVGNSPDPLDANWLDPQVAGLATEAEMNAWWLEIVRAMGVEETLFRYRLTALMDPKRHPDIAERIVALRPAMARRLGEAKLADVVRFFDPDRFHPSLSVVENLLFAVADKPLSAAELARDPAFMRDVCDRGLEQQLTALADDLLSALAHTFAEVGAEHPLFQEMTGVDAETFERLMELRKRQRRPGGGALSAEDRALLLSLPFAIRPDQMGDAFPRRLRRELLRMRQESRTSLMAHAEDLFTPLDPERYAPGLSLLENLLFARIAPGAGAAREAVTDLAAALLEEEGLTGEIALLIGDVEAGLGGANLPRIAQERIGFVRAAIKRPDVLILERALASHTPEQRSQMRRRLRALLPETTILFLEPAFIRPEEYDLLLEIKHGRLVKAAPARAEDTADDAEEGGDGSEPALEPTIASDLTAKLEALSGASLFRGLSRRQLRLLAFASHWITARSGEALFRRGDVADGAYLLTRGVAELRWPRRSEESDPISVVEPGRLVGDLSVIRGTPRDLDMVARTDVVGLRIGAKELLSIVESDPEVAVALLRTVAGYLSNMAGKLLDAKERLPSEKV